MTDAKKRLHPPPTSIQPALAELERAYEALRPRFAKCTDRDYLEAHRPVILVQHRGRRKVLGWMAPIRWMRDDGDEPISAPARFNEITLAAEVISRDGGRGAFETLVHEMVHHVNAVRGVRDCNVNQYHTKAFATLAEAVGLIVTKHPTRGFAETTLGPKLEALWRRLRIDENAFRIFRAEPSAADVRVGRMLKWACGCGRIFRAAVDHHAVCLDCQQPYVKQAPTVVAA